MNKVHVETKTEKTAHVYGEDGLAVWVTWEPGQSTAHISSSMAYLTRAGIDKLIEALLMAKEELK